MSEKQYRIKERKFLQGKARGRIGWLILLGLRMPLKGEGLRL